MILYNQKLGYLIQDFKKNNKKASDFFLNVFLVEIKTKKEPLRKGKKRLTIYLNIEKVNGQFNCYNYADERAEITAKSNLYGDMIFLSFFNIKNVNKGLLKRTAKAHYLEKKINLIENETNSEKTLQNPIIFREITKIIKDEISDYKATYLKRQETFLNALNNERKEAFKSFRNSKKYRFIEAVKINLKKSKLIEYLNSVDLILFKELISACVYRLNRDLKTTLNVGEIIEIGEAIERKWKTRLYYADLYKSIKADFLKMGLNEEEAKRKTKAKILNEHTKPKER